MKKIEAFIRHEAFEPIRTELLDKGFPVPVDRRGEGVRAPEGHRRDYRGSSLTVHVRPKLNSSRGRGHDVGVVARRS